MGYTPETGWAEVNAELGQKMREAVRTKAPRLMEGWRVVCIPEPFDLSKMKRPVMLVAMNVNTDDFCAALNAAKIDFPPIPVRRSKYLPDDTIAFMETATPPIAVRPLL